MAAAASTTFSRSSIRVLVASADSLFRKRLMQSPAHEVERLGSAEAYSVDVRVICATNMNPLEHIQTKQFRQDLYYRLAIFPLVVPPLRERAEDMSVLCEHFLGRLCAENSVRPKQLTASALALLQRAAWEGNVRGLQHAVERAFILSGDTNTLRAEHFQSFGDRTN